MNYHWNYKPKLLRVLQEGEVEPSAWQPITVNVRVISAANRQLNELVETGGFREDLFYRLMSYVYTAQI